MKPELSLGIKVIDYEHAKILSLLDELQAGPVNPSEVIRALNEYTERHFLVEEEMMAAYGYPELEEHCKQHDFFRTKVRGLINTMGTDEITRTKAVGDFLAIWIEQHISQVDRHLADFIHRQQNTA